MTLWNQPIDQEADRWGPARVRARSFPPPPCPCRLSNRIVEMREPERGRVTDLSRGAAFSITLPVLSLNTEPDRLRTGINPRAQTRLVAKFVGVGGALWRENIREG